MTRLKSAGLFFCSLGESLVIRALGIDLGALTVSHSHLMAAPGDEGNRGNSSRSLQPPGTFSSLVLQPTGQQFNDFNESTRIPVENMRQTALLLMAVVESKAAHVVNQLQGQSTNHVP